MGADLVDVLNDSFSAGTLPPLLRGALISLVFKKGDCLEVKNWHPISLLNVDYKLCARALAGRLLKVLHHVTGPDQTCGVPGHFIGENVDLLRDLVDYIFETGIPAAILSLDQEKAFDRVNWPFPFRTLACMGFGASFISWVKLLYSGIQSAILVNGYTSDFFRPSRGVRQGCLLSPLLYVVSIEVLSANLHAHPDIAGIRPPGHSCSLPVISLYADDTSVIVNSLAAIRAVFGVYRVFESGSGSRLNLGKCEGLWLGPWRFCTSPPPWTFPGPSLRSKFWGFLSDREIVPRKTGALVWMLLPGVSTHGARGLFPLPEKRWSLMPWRSPVFGMWPHWSTCLPGSVLSVTSLFINFSCPASGTLFPAKSWLTLRGRAVFRWSLSSVRLLPFCPSRSGGLLCAPMAGCTC